MDTPPDTKHRTTECSDSTAQRLRDMTTTRQTTVLARLWTRMCSIYGADRWERAYGAQPAPGWAQALGHCTPQDLARGISRCERDDSGRLPTLGQLVTFCREHQPGTFAGASAPDARPLPSLEQLGARTAAGRRWLAYMWLYGILPRPPRATDSVLEAMLGDADLESMRVQVAEQREQLERRMRVAQ
jgi:hypothetical protein